MIRTIAIASTFFSLLALSLSNAHAAVINFEVDVNSSDANTGVHATAQVTTTTDTVTITLTNLMINQKTVAQSISGFEFSLSDAPSSLTLQTLTAVSREINSDKTFTDGTNTVDAWPSSLAGNHIVLDSLTGTGSHKWTIIGQPDSNAKYPNANNSLTGGHANPAIGETATFVFNVPGVTDLTTVLADSVKIWFNTDANTTPSNKIPPTIVPEPATLALMAMGGLLIGTGRKTR